MNTLIMAGTICLVSSVVLLTVAVLKFIIHETFGKRKQNP